MSNAVPGSGTPVSDAPLSGAGKEEGNGAEEGGGERRAVSGGDYAKYLLWCIYVQYNNNWHRINASLYIALIYYISTFLYYLYFCSDAGLCIVLVWKIKRKVISMYIQRCIILCRLLLYYIDVHQ